ncbi:hypothetical protein MK805_09335 [Shimazuella sp. AN120528]|uniref:hypothetical protein n=1 Tax=Shimazuella soli TaxID=1892854 RepID=UPI001F0F4E4A|nr:hypothetical protein [Shimazuella soli]MCH5585172.1 hypothetical protein [Shimazuella soli]
MALKLVVEGENEKVRGFIKEILSYKTYRFYDRSKYFISPVEMRVEYYFDESRFLREEKRDIKRISLKVDEQRTIEFDLLDSKVIDMNGTMLIIGKNFDIFS